MHPPAKGAGGRKVTGPVAQALAGCHTQSSGPLTPVWPSRGREEEEKEKEKKTFKKPPLRPLRLKQLTRPTWLTGQLREANHAEISPVTASLASCIIYFC
ncbi:hypothetical protein NDU88_003796 [Pleurodeles waltl]|uniref:Uncharacterized protein n=1 Tax=Pleurodeles waltl TaxID=8319 RepID=A0AAV7W7Z5_PLEWA|nr:hypothetical protein NDU88_003796 [Pleurodeles waltl]